ncbi:MAG TPA: methyltransferase MtaB domain-containing protein [Desulfosporosinus sp.]|nr:methyltransferase MtaB domain-containing protein [Desulfosporosinus sp.]
MAVKFTELAYKNVDEFVYAYAKKPVKLANGMVIGGGTMYPELNYTLPTMLVNADTMPEVIAQYQEMTTGVCEMGLEQMVPGMLIECELLPECTFVPEWGGQVTKAIKDIMVEFEAKGLKSALRMTVIDSREGKVALKHMYEGKEWDQVINTFKLCTENGADFLSIESIGGKHLHDEAVLNVDIVKNTFSLGVIGCRDMTILWDEIVKIAKTGKACLPAGDTACGFANTSMVMGHKNFIPKVFAAIDRVQCAVRTLVAVECGAVGPDKDCGYEGPYLKAISGTPITMEGRVAACAHSSAVGNIALALADCWSNESVQNIRLLGNMAPTVSMEQLAYDCRQMNKATEKGFALQMRDILVESDNQFDPTAYIMTPAVVLRISAEIIKGKTHLERTILAGLATINELRQAITSGYLKVAAKEVKYLDRFEKQLKAIPEEKQFIAEQIKANPKHDLGMYNIS